MIEYKEKYGSGKMASRLTAVMSQMCLINLIELGGPFLYRAPACFMFSVETTLIPI